MDAWRRELQIVMREQAVSAMIQESYVKELCRVKQNMEEALNEEQEQTLPPTTASSQNRFHRKNNSKQRGNNTLRRPFDNSASIV